MLFLSYAREDAQVANDVAAWLESHGHRVDPQPTPTINGTEERISQVDDYVALLSPDFLASPACRRERELAVCREQGLRLRYPGMKFVHVLSVRDTPEPDGLPPRDDWLDLTDTRGMANVLEQLTTRLGSVSRAGRSAGPSPGKGWVFFRNRSYELDLAVRGLTNPAGPHFWLLIAPPQLGKTWLLDRLVARLHLEERDTWVVRLVDIRDQKAEVRTDVESLIRCLFEPDGPATPELSTYIQIAQKIITSRQRHICLIDSAELLADDTARTLRACLSEVYRLVSEAGLVQAQLAVVVASRREDEWRGITPAPRLSISKLSEFSVDIVRETLAALADEMDRGFETTQLQRYASRVHRLSEGLPALLSRCIAWIRYEEWAGMERLETDQLFRELAQPYINNSLLARESLFPTSRGQPELPNASLPALEHALRVLSPYRLFTQSHLRHYHDLNSGLRTSMESLHWGVDDLWRAISNSALLTRPLDEPWQQIPVAIRRLLYRHYLATASERAEAHKEARTFMAAWADSQSGKEQVIGMVECLWHDASALRLERPSDLQSELIRSAGELSRNLRESTAFSPSELREFAAQLISRDEEFQEVVGEHGLVGRIIAAIITPPDG